MTTFQECSVISFTRSNWTYANILLYYVGILLIFFPILILIYPPPATKQFFFIQVMLYGLGTERPRLGRLWARVLRLGMPGGRALRPRTLFCRWLWGVGAWENFLQNRKKIPKMIILSISGYMALPMVKGRGQLLLLTCTCLDRYTQSNQSQQIVSQVLLHLHLFR